MSAAVNKILACLLLASVLVGCSQTRAASPPAQKRSAPPPPQALAVPTGEDAGLPRWVLGTEPGIPDWVGQDKDEPFDVKAFLRSRAGPADNAAPLLMAALADISTDMYQPQPPPGWPWDKDKIPPAVIEADKAIGDLSDPDKLKSDSVSAEDIESMLAKAAPALEKLDRAQRRSRCVFLTGLRWDAVLPHAQASRQLAHLEVIELCHARLKGDFDEAQRAVRRTLRLSRDLRPRGFMVSQLVSLTIDGMILSGVADFTLGQPGLKPEHCDRLLALLSEHQRKALSTADEGIRTEYICLRNSFDALQHGRMSAKFVADLFQAFQTYPSNGLQAPPADQPAVDRLLQQVNWQTETAACNVAFAGALAAAAVPYERVTTQQWTENTLPKIKAMNTSLAIFFLPAVDAFLAGRARTAARVAGIECLILVRRYALAHNNALPPDLATAASEAGLKAVPTDPYSGQPMRYKVIDDKPVVYSVGPDRKNDGEAASPEEGKPPQDFIYRIRE